jgi:hypothetical protein
VELPTYTNIWKIEKRLYKLYDFRLPMPVPVGQLATFLAIAVPYMLILTMAGMPFSHTWVWLYVLPPGVLAWLVTRPVLEGKRLPELVLSQLRYLSEPRTWCRMAPLAEKDVITVVATVWRRSSAGAAELRSSAELAKAAELARAAELAASARPAMAAQATAAQATAVQATEAGRAASERLAAQAGTAVPERPVWPSRPAFNSQPRAEQAATAPAATQRTPPAPAAAAARRPAFTVRTDSTSAQPLRVVERALRSSPGASANGWHDRVVVVPGGHRPGKPDQVQRDQARARLPLGGPARIVVLGCTAGAGQTMTTLLTGQLLATLRAEPVAVLDLSPGPGSLTELARRIPRLFPGRQAAAAMARSSDGQGSVRERGLQVVTADSAAAEPGDVGELMTAVVARYPLTLADPAAAQVPRALAAADQLVLVTPASADAGAALAMTLEWLDAHGHAALGRTAVTVLNGVSDKTTVHVEKAAAVATGRCRAIVRVPWDNRLGSDSALSAGEAALGAAAVQAYTALAGVLVAGLAGRARRVGATVDAQPAGAAAIAGTGIPAERGRSAEE